MALIQRGYLLSCAELSHHELIINIVANSWLMLLIFKREFNLETLLNSACLCYRFSSLTEHWKHVLPRASFTQCHTFILALFWTPKHLVLHAHTHTDASGATRVQYLARGYSDMRSAVAGDQATDHLIVDDPLYLLSLHCPQARSAWYSQMVSRPSTNQASPCLLSGIRRALRL